MKNYNARKEKQKIRKETEKQQKISALSSGKIDKYDYLTGENILSSD